VARNRYIKAVQDYNVPVRTFPNNLTAMVFGWQVKPNFTVGTSASKQPAMLRACAALLFGVWFSLAGAQTLQGRKGDLRRRARRPC
jgi:hypothetical protein